MKNIDWNNVSEIGTSPVPGGYAARITAVEDREDKEYLLIKWDFADGPYKGSNADTFDRLGFWPIAFIRSYKKKALPFFKAFKTAVEKSNPGYVFKNDSQSLVGKFVGVVLGEEEYKGNDGNIKKRLYVAEIHSGEKIRSGDFKVPELKTLPGSESQYNQPAQPVVGSDDFAVIEDDDDLPF